MENGRKKTPDITWKRQKEGNGEGVEYIYRPKIVLWKQALMASPAFIYPHYSMKMSIRLQIQQNTYVISTVKSSSLNVQLFIVVIYFTHFYTTFASEMLILFIMGLHYKQVFTIKREEYFCNLGGCSFRTTFLEAHF